MYVCVTHQHTKRVINITFKLLLRQTMMFLLFNLFWLKSSCTRNMWPCIYRVRHLTFLFQLVLMSDHVWFDRWLVLSFRRMNMAVYTLVYASLSGPAIDLQKMPILTKKKKSLDEAHFDLGGYVNKQNCCIWGTENPHAYVEKPTHPKRVNVWCGFCPRGIIASFFFENEQREAVTVNGDRYQDMLKEFLFTKIEETDIGSIWFQRRYVPHSRSYTRCFAPCFWRSYYQPKNWCCLATSELRFETVGLLFVVCRQR